LSKEEHNKTAKIENLIWEAAKILNPDSYIEPKKIQDVKQHLLRILQD